VLIFDQVAGQPIVLTDEREAEVGKRFRQAMDALPSGSPDHTVELRRYMETMRGFRNRPDGFWVASSNPDAADGAITGTIETSSIHAALLLSDGASRLTDRFALATWSQLVQLVTDQGPDALISRVRDAERTDPDGHRWPEARSTTTPLPSIAESGSNPSRAVLRPARRRVSSLRCGPRRHR
jgi:hypothetical protein